MKKYFSLVAFSHTVFALPFAVIGFLLAWQRAGIPFPVWLFIEMLVCMITARTAAMAFNRFLDADIDAKNPRTAQREIPTGKISKAAALAMVVVCCSLFVLTCFFINHVCFYLSSVALAVVLGYSYTKRFTSLSHFVLGLGLSLAPVGAYLAVRPLFDWLPIMFSCVVLLWVGGFDVIYALQDVEFDTSNRLHSLPARFGRSRALRWSETAHVLCGALVVAAGWVGAFGLWYWIGVACFVALLLYQHAIVKPNDLRRVNRAFFTTNGVASIVFALFVCADILMHA